MLKQLMTRPILLTFLDISSEEEVNQYGENGLASVELEHITVGIIYKTGGMQSSCITRLNAPTNSFNVTVNGCYLVVVLW